MTTRSLSTLVVTAALLAACSRATQAPHPAVPAPQPATPTAAEAPAPASQQVVTDLQDQAIELHVRMQLKDRGGDVSENAPVRLLALPLQPVPQGYRRLVSAVWYDTLYLFGVNAPDGSDVRLLQELPGAIIHTIKLWPAGDTSRLSLRSQAPFSAAELTSVYAWDGLQLKLAEQKHGDPSDEYFQKRAALIQQGDLNGIMSLGPDPLYPAHYFPYFAQPKPLLQLAYNQALPSYRAGKLDEAIRYLAYGLNQYEDVYGAFGEKPVVTSYQEYQFTPAELAPIVNDYAFFLAEAGKRADAEPLLERVIQIAPQRAVAYLNLGDVEWSLEQQELARTHYRKYLELLGPNKTEAPARVSKRLGQS